MSTYVCWWKFRGITYLQFTYNEIIHNMWKHITWLILSAVVVSNVSVLPICPVKDKKTKAQAGTCLQQKASSLLSNLLRHSLHHRRNNVLLERGQVLGNTSVNLVVLLPHLKACFETVVLIFNYRVKYNFAVVFTFFSAGCTSARSAKRIKEPRRAIFLSSFCNANLIRKAIPSLTFAWPGSSKNWLLFVQLMRFQIVAFYHLFVQISLKFKEKWRLLFQGERFGEFTDRIWCLLDAKYRFTGT